MYVILNHSFFLTHHVILNLIQDRIYFFQKVFDFFLFFISSLFLFFYKNYYHFTKEGGLSQSPKPDSFEFDLFTVDISSRVTPARLYRALFLQVKAKQLLAQSFLTLFLLYKQRCKARSLCLGQSAAPKNPPTSEIEVSSVSYEQIRVVIFVLTTYRSVYYKDKKNYF